MMLYNYNPNAHTRWSSFENLSGAKGAAAMENNGAKGHAFDAIPAHGKVTMMQTEGSGVVRRMWITINERDAYILRALVLRMYWDGAEKPAVECPLGDFFAFNLGKMQAFDSELVSSPEGKSFHCTIPMPFRKGARIEICNESDRHVSHLFFDVDYTLESVAEDTLYFHAWWNRENPTALGVDYTILPKLSGHGRFLGTSIGIHAAPEYKPTWFGEGEVKFFLDGDGKYPTLSGTGLEDYTGTAWCLGTFTNRTQGCMEAEEGNRYTFYRWHIDDPVWFHEDIRMTLQQIGGGGANDVAEVQKKGCSMHVVSADWMGDLKPLYDPEKPSYVINPESEEDKGRYFNYYRQDDYSSVAYFYFGAPASDLPAIQGLEARTAHTEK